MTIATYFGIEVTCPGWVTHIAADPDGDIVGFAGEPQPFYNEGSPCWTSARGGCLLMFGALPAKGDFYPPMEV